jgi:hypothetical protein
MKTEKHWKHRKAHRKHPKCHQKHRKHIGKVSERHRKGIGKEIITPQNALVLTSRDDPGIGKASERHRKTSGNIGKHGETSESIGKDRTPLEEPEQEWKFPLSFGLVDLQYKAAALGTFGDCIFLYFNSLLVCSAVKVDRMLVTN